MDTKSQNYALIMDEKRNAILSILYTMSRSNAISRTIFENSCLVQGVSKGDIKDFFKDWAAKEHELGWCKDPTCSTNKQKND